jgi:hypothetical protein
MNQLNVGFNKKVMPVGGCLFIGDDISEVRHKFRPKVFDPAKHSFNPIKDITEAQAQEFVEVIYSVYGLGENTMTVRNGQIDLAPALYKGKRLDELRGSEEVERLRDDMVGIGVNPVIPFFSINASRPAPCIVRDVRHQTLIPNNRTCCSISDPELDGMFHTSWR